MQRNYATPLPAWQEALQELHLPLYDLAIQKSQLTIPPALLATADEVIE